MPGRSAADFAADREFEDEVLRLARLMYPDPDGGGAAILAGRERDGILVTRDLAIAIEATRSRRVAKAEEDAKKLKQATESLSRKNPTKGVRGFLITADEPTAEQREAVRKHGGNLVSALSLATFRRQLFDAGEYVGLRERYPFGSVRDPFTNKAYLSTKYVDLELMQRPDLQRGWSVDEIATGLLEGGRFVLTGEYGVGKSMTLREVWFRLRDRLRADSLTPAPIHLNLRNHQGQDDPSEALHRHADRVGLSDHAQLVRAWRAGQVTLFLDGFDEITFPGWAGRVAALNDVRRRNVALIRKFIDESPQRTGVIVAGRAHFFDSDLEMSRALGLQPGFVHLSASDFTPAQIDEYLKAHDLRAVVPEWMPARPLIVGYLASLGLLAAVPTESSPATGWDTILTRLCEREALIEVGLDGYMIRRILERLASRARRTVSGRGPLRFDELNDTFREICGFQPDEGSRVVLDRLPGLGVGTAVEPETPDLPREFVDADLADAARAGDVFHFISAPHAAVLPVESVRDWNYLLEDLGLDVVMHRLDDSGLNADAISAALESAVKQHGESGLVVDLLRLVLANGASVRGSAPAVSNFVIPSLDIAASADAGASVLRSCIVERLEIEEGYATDGLPRFAETHIECIVGATSAEDLPKEKLDDSCSFGDFADSASNTASILDLRLPDETRVMLTILKKVYTQRGRGRKESALSRGLDPKLRRFVPDAIARLQSEGLLVPGRARREMIWLPAKAGQRRALQLLAAPMSSQDPLIAR